MSIEQKIEGLTVALGKLTALIETLAAAQSQPAKPVMETSFATPAPAPTVTPVVVPVAPVAPVLPAAPSFVSPPPVTPAAPVVPFTDNKGLVDYVMTAYKAMGAEKGAQIQTVLTHLKYNNINDVQPEHYTALYLGIEQLKAS